MDLSSKKKIIFFNLLTFAGVFVVLIGFFEIGLRLVGRTSDNFLKQDAVLGWTHVPNKKGWSVTREYRVPVQLNNFGLVGPDTSLEKPAETFRVAFVGDSFTEAFQVETEAAFPRVIEKRVNDLGKKVETLNFGVTSYGTVKEDWVIKNSALRFNPDLIVLGYFVGNDFADNLAGDINPTAQFSSRKKFTNSVKLWFRNHSVAYRWFLEKKSRNAFLSDPAPVFVPAIYGPNSIFGSKYSSAAEEGMAKTKTYLKNISDILREQDINFLVLILPAKEQVHERLRSSEDSNLDWEKPNRMLKEFFEQEKIAYLDTLPTFQSWAKINPEGLAFFKFDGHPNETGHFLIAKGILNYLDQYFYGK
ncbi:MAG: GDSL-type esterase/lipase family protein [bacterium]|nr:GDSL-type esterase/lipase family protein [bacterium]